MKNILIPTDFSKNAWNAIKYAMHLFEQEKCTFHFLHTYTPAAYAYDFNSGAGAIGVGSLKTKNDTVYQVSQEELRKTVEKVVVHYPNKNHHYNTISAYDILIDEINDVVKKQHIDLVILGTKGATGAKEVFFGSNAIHVMKTTECPVLSIPNTCHFKYIDDILFPSDYKQRYTKNNLKPIIEVARLNEAVVHAFHISNELELTIEQDDNRDAIDKYFESIKHDFKEVPDADVPEAISKYINENNIGLLAMTRRKHSFLERLLFKQNISVLGMHVKIPLLVLPVQ